MRPPICSVEWGEITLKIPVNLRQITTINDIRASLSDGCKSVCTRFIALALLTLSFAADATLLTPELRKVEQLQDVQFLEDPSGRLTLEDVKAMSDSFRPWRGPGDELNFGYNDSNWWIRLPIRRLANTPDSWLLEIHYAKLSEIDFYPPAGPPILTGSRRPFSSKAYFDSNFVFPIRATTEPEYFYFRVASHYPVSVPITIWAPDSFRENKQRYLALQFMYFGGILVLLLYGVVLYAALREKQFMIYSAYVLTVGMGMLSGNGLGRLLLWPEARDFDEISQSLFFGLAAFFITVFVIKIVLPAHDRRWLARSMKLSGFIFLLVAVLTILHWVTPLSLLSVSDQLLMATALCIGLLVSVASVDAWRQRLPGIHFFAVGWLVLWLGGAIAALRAFGLIASNTLTSYAVQIATSIEMVFMAMMLASMLYREQKVHRATQAEALTAQQTLLELSQESEEKLKNTVAARTEQLEKSLQQEKFLRKQYVRFGSMISHEFRTPLNILLSQISLLKKEREKGIDQIERRLDSMTSATQRLTVMFDNWLNNDALNDTLHTLNARPIEVKPWLERLIKTNPDREFSHKIAMCFHITTTTITADDYHLGLAVNNLIDNAVKYSPNHSTITLGAREKPGHVGITVRDEGPGIPQELHSQIFTDFFRHVPESQIKGAGLGLSIVRRIAEAHDGHVELVSAPGEGSEFCIWLPIQTSEKVK